MYCFVFQHGVCRRGLFLFIDLRVSSQRFSYIKHPQRRKYAAMVTSLDESVRDIKAALQNRGMLKDSVIIFSTDNGGAPYGFNW